MSFTKLDYRQYLLSSPINYTVTNLADPLAGISHDRINRYLRGEKLTLVCCGITSNGCCSRVRMPTSYSRYRP